MPADNDREQVTVREAGAKGGQARAKALSPEKRQAIARRAAEARWGAKAPAVTTSGPVTAEPLTADDVRALYDEQAVPPGSRRLLFGRDAVGVLLAENARLRALLNAGAEQVHVMERELRALRRQLEDARRDAGAFLRELEQL
jgi:hypothetical protein